MPDKAELALSLLTDSQQSTMLTLFALYRKDPLLRREHMLSLWQLKESTTILISTQVKNDQKLKPCVFAFKFPSYKG